MNDVDIYPFQPWAVLGNWGQNRGSGFLYCGHCVTARKPRIHYSGAILAHSARAAHLHFMGQTTHNLTSQWIATAYNAGVSIFLMFLLGRVLGPEAFGRYSYILTLASLFLFFKMVGLEPFFFGKKPCRLQG